jgi:succinate dehydrogenase/fumarate reductase flavoprotein subunit
MAQRKHDSSTDGLSRRRFLQGATLAVGAATLGLAGCATKDEEVAAEVPADDSTAWDYETDVAVVGLGGAGGVTAIEAADNGAEVVIIEVDAFDTRLSNSRLSGGIFYSPDADGDKTALASYMRAIMSGENLSFKTEPEQSPLFVDDIVDKFVEYLPTNRDWVLGLDPELQLIELGGAAFPTFPGAQDCSFRTWTPSYTGDNSVEGNAPFPTNQRPKLETANGLALMWAIEYAIEQRKDKITVVYETKGEHLIQDADGVIIGVLAKNSAGAEVKIKARKGVVITSGGFEYNPEMRRAFLEGPGITGWAFYGTPSNDGIGIRMGIEAGAQLAKVGKAASRMIFSCPDIQYNGLSVGTITNGVGTQGTFMVNATGDRFMDETLIQRDPSRYFSYKEAVHMDIKTLEFPNLPSYVIFDEPRRLKACMVGITNSTAGWGIIPWDKENSIPVEKGWIYKADTIEELAEVIKSKHDLNANRMDAAKLAEAAAKYAEVVATGFDVEFGRQLRGSEKAWDPVATPPFYAMPVVAGGPNTKGGLQADGNRHVIDWDNKIIPRLYTAGEVSSAFKFVYQGGGNITECIVCGRIAGKNVAAEASI